MSVIDILEQAQSLTIQERKLLVKLLVDTLDQPEQSPPLEDKHSILELAGLGAEIWKGVDAQDYVNRLRGEWEHRP